MEFNEIRDARYEQWRNNWKSIAKVFEFRHEEVGTSLL